MNNGAATMNFVREEKRKRKQDSAVHDQDYPIRIDLRSQRTVNYAELVMEKYGVNIFADPMTGTTSTVSDDDCPLAELVNPKKPKVDKKTKSPKTGRKCALKSLKNVPSKLDDYLNAFGDVYEADSFIDDSEAVDETVPPARPATSAVSVLVSNVKERRFPIPATTGGFYVSHVKRRKKNPPKLAESQGTSSFSSSAAVCKTENDASNAKKKQSSRASQLAPAPSRRPHRPANAPVPRRKLPVVEFARRERSKKMAVQSPMMKQLKTDDSEEKFCVLIQSRANRSIGLIRAMKNIA